MSLFIEQIQINRNSKEAVFYVKKLPTVHRKLETPMITVSSVAEEGITTDAKIINRLYFIRTYKFKN
jgi:hypothetical protein